MAGQILRESIDEVRARVRIDDIVGQYVALRPSGPDSLKGLCPFHDEKTPSFHVRVSVGRWHCFGCGEGGDAIEFIRREENLSFVEAVEYLARKVGVQLRYEERGPHNSRQTGSEHIKNSRLIDAHRVAVEFYQHLLFHTPEGKEAAQTLYQRGFQKDDLTLFSIGYSPKEWDRLTRVLFEKGFSAEEIEASGLATRGQRGLYDRFRGRLMWPIFSLSGEPIGFGARKVHDSDEGPKYLNTKETPIYRKSDVLFGIHHAKKSIVSSRQVVIVEGYTDVMAMHLAGVPNAVATCGTAFGQGHVRIVRRLLGDYRNPAAGVQLSGGNVLGGEVIFTFDGDEAGKKAAMRAFSEDQNFATQTFVAVAPGGMDPCEVRMTHGDAAVRALVAGRIPLYKFVILSTLSQVDVRTPEGRSNGLRLAAPIVASIRDHVLRGEYVRELTDWLGMEEATVRQAVMRAGRDARALRTAAAHSQSDEESGQGKEKATPEGAQGLRSMLGVQAIPSFEQLTDPSQRLERQALQVYLQLPWYVENSGLATLPAQAFTNPTHQAVYEAILAAGGAARFSQRLDYLRTSGKPDSQLWSLAGRWFVEQVIREAGPLLAPAINVIAVEPLHEDRPEQLPRFAWSVSVMMIRQTCLRQISLLRVQLRQADPEQPEYQELYERLLRLEQTRRECDQSLEQI